MIILSKLKILKNLEKIHKFEISISSKQRIVNKHENRYTRLMYRNTYFSYTSAPVYITVILAFGWSCVQGELNIR